MPVQDDTIAHRRHLPHLEKRGKTYFVTFATINRETLSSRARDIALSCCVHGHCTKYWLHCAVVMPDHVHIILTPNEDSSVGAILQTTKSVSSHLINRAQKRHGPIWQDESFDRIVRASEDLRKKAEYVCANPVRAGLVQKADDWYWLWREWVHD